jgi:hypothetical protein
MLGAHAGLHPARETRWRRISGAALSSPNGGRDPTEPRPCAKVIASATPRPMTAAWRVNGNSGSIAAEPLPTW